MEKCICILVFLLYAAFAIGQTDTLQGETNVVISAYKWEQKLNEIPNKVIKITQKDIALNNPQTAADMLAQTGGVFVQKSQLAGGSPMIRGFATNRVLLVVDGVRMNNAIYRSGNLQNVLNIDPLAIQSAEVIFGPGSMVYGSDAIGGVMHFQSLQARLKTNDSGNKLQVSGNALARYSSANHEQTYHADVSMGGKKLAWMGSITHSSFNDLTMGKHGGQQYYLRPEYVQRINNRDSIIQNPNSREQLFSGFNQLQVVQKLRYQPSKNIDLQYSFHYGETGTAPRYDRLIEYRNDALRFAEWNYGPMVWQMHSLKASLLKTTAAYDEARLIVAYQHYEESRIDRQRNNLNRRTQREEVDIWSVNFDANKRLGKGNFFYGVEFLTNKVGSTGNSENITTGVQTAVAARYPNGSSWNSSGMYGLYKINIKPTLTLHAGLRYNYAEANATFDQTFFPLPFTAAKVSNGAVTPSAGLVWRASNNWQLHTNISTGFRIPNIDDMGKLFESNPGNVIIPNNDLKSEYAINYEAGIATRKPNNHTVELIGFFTRLNNALVRRPFSLNGQDSIIFDGVNSQVEALQNIGYATVYGLQFLGEYWLHKNLHLYVMANYLQGKETDDSRNTQVALRHAPPFFGSAGIKYRNNGWSAEFFGLYNSAIQHEDLAPSEQAKTAIYAKDAQGRTYSPGWYTLNLRAAYTWDRYMLSAGFENITNQQYRPYSSGIVAPGSNLIISGRFAL